jgi:hypothetical protein
VISPYWINTSRAAPTVWSPFVTTLWNGSYRIVGLGMSESGRMWRLERWCHPGGVIAADCIQIIQGASGAPGSWLEQLPHLKGYWNVIRKGKAQSLEAALEQPKGKKAEVMQALGIQRGVWAIGAELSTGYARFLKFRQRETDIDGRMLIVGTTSQELLNHPALCFGGRETIGAKISQPEGLR